jgi:hypothetical protein
MKRALAESSSGRSRPKRAEEYRMPREV